MNPAGLTNKEICELRIKCLEPFIKTASILGLREGEVFELAEKAWKFAIETLGEAPKDNSVKSPKGK
jgi:hypothetical protein